MMPPTSIDGTDITGATIDGTEVEEITVDGDTVFTAQVQFPLVIDDFEDGNFNGWSGDTASYAVEPAFSDMVGNNMLRGSRDRPGAQNIQSFPGDGLQYYPQKGDTIRFRMALESLSTSIVEFGYSPADWSVFMRGTSSAGDAFVRTNDANPDVIFASNLNELDVLEMTFHWKTNGDIEIVEVKNVTQNDFTAFNVNVPSSSTSNDKGIRLRAARNSGANNVDTFWDQFEIIDSTTR